MITIRHTFEPMTEDMRPQDERLDGSTLAFETLEHGGDFPDTMPKVVSVHTFRSQSKGVLSGLTVSTWKTQSIRRKRDDK